LKQLPAFGFQAQFRNIPREIEAAARAGLDLQNDLLLPNLRELRRHAARERVGAAAWRAL